MKDDFKTLLSNQKIMRGIYVGRFQPLHNGHLYCIKQALSRVDDLIIVIAAAQYSHTKRNPFTAGERYEMLIGTLRDEKVPPDRVYIIPAIDINDNALWIYHIKRLVPRFEIAFSNNSFTTMLFENADIDVEHIPLVERERYHATAIRKRIVNNESIEQLVPPFVVSFLKSIGASTRLRNASVSVDDPRNL